MYPQRGCWPPSGSSRPFLPLALQWGRPCFLECDCPSPPEKLTHCERPWASSQTSLCLSFPIWKKWGHLLPAVAGPSMPLPPHPLIQPWAPVPLFCWVCRSPPEPSAPAPCSASSSVIQPLRVRAWCWVGGRALFYIYLIMKSLLWEQKCSRPGLVAHDCPPVRFWGLAGALLGGAPG